MTELLAWLFGLEDVEVVATHEVVQGMHGAIVRATKPRT